MHCTVVAICCGPSSQLQVQEDAIMALCRIANADIISGKMTIKDVGRDERESNQLATVVGGAGESAIIMLSTVRRCLLYSL